MPSKETARLAKTSSFWRKCVLPFKKYIQLIWEIFQSYNILSKHQIPTQHAVCH
jgi:hypothetical protein